MWPVVRANTASGGAELELPLVEPVVLALELELEPGSSIAVTLPVTMRPTPPTVTVTSPRLAVAIVTSGVPADCPLWASQMETPISAAARQRGDGERAVGLTGNQGRHLEPPRSDRAVCGGSSCEKSVITCRLHPAHPR
jgi:hypothetical protein